MTILGAPLPLLLVSSMVQWLYDRLMAICIYKNSVQSCSIATSNKTFFLNGLMSKIFHCYKSYHKIHCCLYFNSLRPIVTYCLSKLGYNWFRNGLSPIRRQAIIYTNFVLLFIGFLVTDYIEIKILLQENTFENIFCKLATNLSRPQCKMVQR